MELARTVADLRSHTAIWRKSGGSIGLVPTMGALHEGHLALVATARRECGRVIASIFVNPKQFGPSEDFAAYPRDEAADLGLLRATGVDLAFLPAVAEMYPPGFATSVAVGGLGEGLCGRRRPGHFAGVATVVTKLLLQSLPDAAYFGEKDYQQLLIIRRLARDLDIPVRIAAVPTVRAADGLALSSRNAYLTTEERRSAPLLARVLREIAGVLAGEPDAVERELARGRAALERAGLAVEYLELRDALTLAPLAAATAPARIFAAVRLGRTRLIDNMPLAA
ncbi:MAG TPA: pantoate--beta-alanine ligase [Stellaceae bacterium]|nr:pantoate--beta-alanine ligase [Stellaceae bacterium]